MISDLKHLIISLCTPLCSRDVLFGQCSKVIRMRMQGDAKQTKFIFFLTTTTRIKNEACHLTWPYTGRFQWWPKWHLLNHAWMSDVTNIGHFSTSSQVTFDHLMTSEPYKNETVVGNRPRRLARVAFIRTWPCVTSHHVTKDHHLKHTVNSEYRSHYWVFQGHG